MPHLRHALLAVLLAATFWIGTVLAIGTARADQFELPGLSNDSQVYADGLTARFPAGGRLATRRTAEQQASAAIQRKDWAAAATALEIRVGQGEATAQNWMDLATAPLLRRPPDALMGLLPGGEAAQMAEATAPR